jgi:hypothetical protein
VNLPNSGSYNWNGNLVGFAEKSSATPDDKMIVRIITSTTDIYIHFNRKVGMNSETEEGEDQVMVGKRKTGLDHGEMTYLVSKMSTDDVYTIPEFDGSASSLEIRVISITTETVPGRAEISIQYDGELAPVSSPAFTSDETPVFTPVVPPTPLPTPPPTRRLTKAPTPVPTKKVPNAKCNFNRRCDLGEDCTTCPSDCNGKRNVYCCVGGKKCRKNECNHSGRFCAV